MSFARLSALWINIVKTQNFGMIFKVQVFEVDINNNGISCNVMQKLTKFHEIKGNNSFRLQFFDKHMVFGCKSVEH